VVKVLGFSGSPKKGSNTEQLVRKVLEGAERKGATTKLHNLAKMDISGCKGCLVCRKEGTCSIKDDMQEIVAEIKSSDAIVIGSPIYMMQMASQTKAFVDRLFPLIKADYTSVLKEGTKAAWVFTQGTADTDAFRAYFDHNESMFGYFGFSVEKTLVVGNTRAKGDLEKQEAKMEEALELGGKLV